jgi:hypothetical protein
MEENKFILDVDVKPLKSQLKGAIQELQAARQKFGEFSQEAVTASQKVAAIRDSIEDANESAQLFDPGKRFGALTTAASQAAAGIAAVQGAFALFGSESENVQKALLKVQGALALSQGLSELKDINKTFDKLKLSINGMTKGMSGFQKALVSTGIGALVVAVGLLVAYWEDIKGLVNGVSGEQAKLNKQAEDRVKTEQDQVSELESSEEILKAQGKSEREILELKVAETGQVIAAQEEQIRLAKITKDSQVAAAKRNQEITKNIIRGGMEVASAGLRLLTLPIDAVLEVANQVSEALGFGVITTFRINDQITKLNEGVSDWAATQLFDPIQTEKDADANIKTLEKSLLESKNKQAGYQNQIKGIDQKGAEDRANKQKEIDDKAREAREAADAVLRERKLSLLTEQQQEEAKIVQKFEEDKKKLQAAGITDFKLLEDSKEKELSLVRDKYRKEEEAKVREYETQLAQIKFETRLALMKEGQAKEIEELRFNYQQQYAEIELNENLNAEQKLQLKTALEQKEKVELDKINKNYLKQQIDDQISALTEEQKNGEISLQIQRELIDKKQKLLEEQRDKGLITEKEYNTGVAALSEERKKIDEIEVQNKEKLLSGLSNIFKNASDLLGKQTAGGKALAIAGATIDTYRAATAAYASLAGIKVVGPALGAVAAGLAIATGLKNVKEIIKTKVPASGGGGGGSLPSGGSPSAPNIMEQATIGNAPVTALMDITKQSQTPIRAFVVESEVTSVQNRVSDIERRAGF